jgi:hypothetical protein
MLKNARHEVFAHGLAEGKTGRAAYMAVYPKCTKPEAADVSAAKASGPARGSGCLTSLAS